MTITCEHVDSVLSAWFEGDLGDEERRAVDMHLRECLRCASMALWPTGRRIPVSRSIRLRRWWLPPVTSG